MIKRIKEMLNQIFQLEEINGHNICPTYLYRWTLLSTRWFKFYLHKFVADDWSQDLHDHPKRFVTIGLWGRYTEHTPVESKIWKAPWIRSFAPQHLHRITIEPSSTCWTIAIVFKSVRNWGFVHNGQWIPWRQYVSSDTAKEMKSCND